MKVYFKIILLFRKYFGTTATMNAIQMLLLKLQEKPT